MRISGRTDRIDRESVSGWVLDLDDPSRRIALEILSGNVSLGQCIADSYREDLHRSQIGDGRCAFRFKIPVAITQAEAERIQLKVLEDCGESPRAQRLQRVGYLASNAGAVPFSARSDGRYLLSNTGGNTGNLAFWYAARRLFVNPIAFVEWNPDNVYSKSLIDKLVIPAANHLNPDWNQEPLALLIERLGKEVVVFGLGAQSQDESSAIPLPKGTIRFLKVLGDHAQTIFVRGTYTAELCCRHGVKNVEPLGCPSILINPDPRLGALIASRWPKAIERLYSAGAAFKSEIQGIERALFAYITAHAGSTYVVQDREELIDCCEGRWDLPAVRKVAARIGSILEPQAELEAFLNTFRRVTRCFGSVRAWLEAAALHDHSVCTRIHGAILSLMAGVPTVVVAHDARIRELCQCMSIPWLRASDAQVKLESLERLFADMVFDGASFDSRRSIIAARYADYLVKVGLVPSQDLQRMAAGGRANHEESLQGPRAT